MLVVDETSGACGERCTGSDDNRLVVAAGRLVMGSSFPTGAQEVGVLVVVVRGDIMELPAVKLCELVFKAVECIIAAD